MFIRRHLTYANVAATLALLFAMGGSAIAANHYLITSKKQIKPSVLAALKGHAGPKGATGAAGAPGGKGETGPKGEAGPKGEPGASATSLWGAIDEGGPIEHASGIVSSKHEGLGGSGEYTVVFERDVSKCAVVVTVRDFPGLGWVQSILGSAVRVRTETDKGEKEDEPFYVAVFC